MVKDGNLVSGQDLGAVFDFAFAIAYLLSGEGDKVREQAGHISHTLKVDFATLNHYYLVSRYADGMFMQRQSARPWG